MCVYVLPILTICQENESKFLFCVPHFSFTLKWILCLFTPVLDNVILKVSYKYADRKHCNQSIKGGPKRIRSNAFSKSAVEANLYNKEI